jgi:tRNA threonylcarbamoyladenosine biosynthesis protein TsaE
MTEKPQPLIRSLELNSLERTRELAARLAGAIDTGGAIAFLGGLGSGKTTFIQGIAEALGCRGLVNSPTYTIVNRYGGGRLTLVHVDCYRVRSEDELWDIGLAEMFTTDALVCVEWSEKSGDILPKSRLEIALEAIGGHSRRAAFRLPEGMWPGVARLLKEES